MRIVSLNCWGGRVPALVDFLPTLDADVYCLQEVYSAPPGTPSPLNSKSAMGQDEAPVLPRLFEDIAAVLPRHQGFFSPHAQGYLHDRATTEYPVRYGIAAFVRDTTVVFSQETKFAFGDFRPHAWGDPPLPRTAHCMRMYDYASKSRVVVAHMHGLWDPQGKMDTSQRLEQAWNLISLVQGMYDPGVDRVVVCGDFNVLPESETLSLLCEHVFARELVTEDGHTSTRTSYYKKEPRFADYMLVNDRVKVRRFEIVREPEVSDHCPLVLDIE